VKKGRMSQAAADAAMAKVQGALNYSSFGEWLAACAPWWQRVRVRACG
jgi:hypothetical protein